MVRLFYFDMLSINCPYTVWESSFLPKFLRNVFPFLRVSWYLKAFIYLFFLICFFFTPTFIKSFKTSIIARHVSMTISPTHCRDTALEYCKSANELPVAKYLSVIINRCFTVIAFLIIVFSLLMSGATIANKFSNVLSSIRK